MVLTQGQEEALANVKGLAKDFPKGGGIAVIAGYAGTGKALAYDQLVQTPNGPAQIGWLRPGDFVLGKNGKPTKVVGVFPQGLRQAYRVVFRDRTSVECDLEHLWAVWTHKRRANGSAPIVLTLREIVEQGLAMKCGIHRFSVPLCDPVQNDDKTLPLDPYLLGLFIGDGTSLGKTPTLCLPDSEHELIELARSKMPHGMTIKVNRAPVCPQWRFTDPTQRSNRITQAMRTLGLAGLKSPDRFVPQMYLLGSIGQRLDLLRGLMDSDGSCNKNRTRFSTKSLRLAQDISTLVQSLGGVTVLSASATRPGEFSVNVKTLQNPFRFSRKANAWKFSHKNPPSRHIVDVVPTRICEHVCIKVESEDGLFLTNGHIVTHNTTLVRSLEEEHGENMLVVTPTGKAAVRVREAAGCPAKTIHSWLYEVAEDEETGALSFQRRNTGLIERPGCGFLVVDEASMVGFKVFADVYQACKNLELNLVLIGDGFQLPPVEMDSKKKDFSVFAPDFPAHSKVTLTEIHRQALDSPIIRASMDVRLGQWATEALSSLPVVKESDLLERAKYFYEQEGATICHRNATRHVLNAGVRGKLGLPSDQISKGEPLLVVQNTYQLEIFNGEIVPILTQPRAVNVAPIAVRDNQNNASKYMDFLEVDIDCPLQGEQAAIVVDAEVFGTNGEVGSYAIKRAVWNFKTTKYGVVNKIPQGPAYVPANFGYVLTCHKSQGSEFNAGIVVVEESLRPNSPEGRRWAYTAITRFKKQIEICWRI